MNPLSRTCLCAALSLFITLPVFSTVDAQEAIGRPVIEMLGPPERQGGGDRPDVNPGRPEERSRPDVNDSRPADRVRDPSLLPEEKQNRVRDGVNPDRPTDRVRDPSLLPEAKRNRVREGVNPAREGVERPATNPNREDRLF